MSNPVHPPLHIANHIPPSQRNVHHHTQHSSTIVTPFSLPAPPTVFQTSAITCWAACFNSITQASGSSLHYSENDLVRMFGPLLTTNGTGISREGVMAEGYILGMYRRVNSGAGFSLAQVRESLQSGYLLLAYRVPITNSGHVVVIYGVTNAGIQIMDPDRGPTFMPLNYIRQCRELITMTPIFGLRSNSNAFSGLSAPGHNEYMYSGGNSDHFGGLLSH